MSWMDISTVLAGFVGVAVCFHEWAISEEDWRPGQKLLATAALWVVVASWCVLVPVSFYLWRNGLSAPWLFGAETYDGGVVETVTATGLIAVVLLSARQALYSATMLTAAFWAGVCLFGVLAFGEEASWGQHMFHWSATGAFATANLQAETNLHNFISPRIYDIAYAIVGWGLVVTAGILSVRPRWMGSLLRIAPFAHASPTGIALMVTGGVLLQHEVFEEMAEAIVILAFVFIQTQLALETRAAGSRRWFAVTRAVGGLPSNSPIPAARLARALKGCTLNEGRLATWGAPTSRRQPSQSGT